MGSRSDRIWIRPSEDESNDIDLISPMASRPEAGADDDEDDEDDDEEEEDQTQTRHQPKRKARGGR